MKLKFDIKSDLFAICNSNIAFMEVFNYKFARMRIFSF